EPEEIFSPFVTTKIDKRGNIIGTGLGMYLVKNVMDDYSGEIQISQPEIGFEIILIFNKRANAL
ncbi:MAG: ATP-binding protein, partial [Bacteroidota bacterium]